MEDGHEVAEAIDRASRRVAASILCAAMMLATNDIPTGQAGTIYEELLDKIGGKR